MIVQAEFRGMQSELHFKQALSYVAVRATALCEEVIGQELPFDTLALFAQSKEEYVAMEGLVLKQGTRSPLTHGLTLYVNPNRLTIENQPVKLLGVRRPDLKRYQVGYADFPVTDYDDIWSAAKAAENPFIEEITTDLGRTLLQLRHPEYDVLAYLVRAEEHAVLAGSEG